MLRISYDNDYYRWWILHNSLQLCTWPHITCDFAMRPPMLIYRHALKRRSMPSPRSTQFLPPDILGLLVCSPKGQPDLWWKSNQFQASITRQHPVDPATNKIKRGFYILPFQLTSVTPWVLKILKVPARWSQPLKLSHLNWVVPVQHIEVVCLPVGELDGRTLQFRSLIVDFPKQKWWFSTAKCWFSLPEANSSHILKMPFMNIYDT